MKRIALALALAALSGCVVVWYQGPGQHITPRSGRTLVFGRLRFFHNEREFYPWEVEIVGTPVETDPERHVWLLRLGARAVSTELHPDEDGSLAIWLGSADYALLGGTDVTVSGPAAFEVVGLLRVPAGPVAAYAGELVVRTESHAGGQLRRGEFGTQSVELQPIDIARVTLEQKFGALSEPPVVSPWCVGDFLPRFDDPGLADRARELLDRGCHDAP